MKEPGYHHAQGLTQQPQIIDLANAAFIAFYLASQALALFREGLFR